MFENCVNLTQIPYLSLSNFSTASYMSMFKNCIRLTDISTGMLSQKTSVNCYKNMFEGCIELTSAPKLPATILSDYCYENMFKDCISLTEAPELPATGLISGCYKSMFKNCSSLSSTVTLPAFNLKPYCYEQMFENCTNFVSAQIGDKSQNFRTAPYSCKKMFKGCSKLTTAPTLKYSNQDLYLYEYCFESMFEDCINLSSAPDLGANTLDIGCFKSMFKGCENLIQAPNLYSGTDLNWTSLKTQCYAHMFENCYKLKYIQANFTIWVESVTSGWVKNVSTNGLFKKPEALPKQYGVDYIPEDWDVEDKGIDFLTFTSKEDGSTIEILNKSEVELPEILFRKYKNDSWAEFKANTQLTLNKNEYCQLSPRNNKLSGIQFKLNGKIQVSGELSTLIDSTKSYQGLFKDCTGLIKAPELPATGLQIEQYKEMFAGCTNLTIAPGLPANDLTSGCYFGMFSGCTSLTAAPVLSSMNLANYCYANMFAGCTSLTSVPELPAEQLFDYCYANMFNSCLGLTKTGQLSSTTLSQGCYYGMFNDCVNLSSSCLLLPALDLSESCYSYMFAGCKKLQIAPELLATTLVTDCYSNMFSNCINLTKLNVSFQEWDVQCTQGWVRNITSEGRFYCTNDLKQLRGTAFIPQNFRKIYDNALTFYPKSTDNQDNTDALVILTGNNINTQDHQIYYNLNNTGWKKYQFNQTYQTDIKTIKFKNLNSNFSTESTYYYFQLTGDWYTSGNINSLIDYQESSSAYCFYRLFKDCSGLITAPELPAQNLVSSCYQEMFTNCLNLSEITVNFIDWQSDINATTNWVSGVNEGGTFKKPYVLSQIYGETYIPYGWSIESIPSEAKMLQLYALDITRADYPLRIYACENNCIVKLNSTANTQQTGLMYRYHKNQQSVNFNLQSQTNIWQKYQFNSQIDLFDKFDYVQFKNVSGILPSCNFEITGKVMAFGNIMSLLNDDSSDEEPQLTSNCFKSLFQGCSGLITAPELPATTLANNCYQSMFQGCISLTTAPELPATTLADYCYFSMFQGCSGLITAPELPATTLAKNCYRSMFQGCTSLKTAPTLPAETLIQNCYDSMFKGCTRLNYIKVAFTEWNYDSNTSDWVDGVADTGTFVKPYMLEEIFNSSWIPKDYDNQWKIQENIEVIYIENQLINIRNQYSIQLQGRNIDNWTSNNLPEGLSLNPATGELSGFKNLVNGIYIFNVTVTNAFNNIKNAEIKLNINASSLTFTSKEDNSIIVLTTHNELQLDYLYYSKNAGQLQHYTSGTQIILNKNEFVNFINQSDHFSESKYGYATFQITGIVESSGNIMSLLNFNDSCTDYCFYKLFDGCSGLTTAPELPATTLAKYCYNNMFYNCTSLSSAPELPATTLAERCYASMFADCTSLTTAPELQVTSLNIGCYSHMFDNCTALTTAPELPAAILADYCYASMFNGCTSLTTAPELPATTLADYCYFGMFYNCTSLVSAPNLLATTLADSCYASMFNGCTSLTTAPELLATTLADSCYDNMFNGCTSLTTAPELSAAILANNCYYQMFYGCTSLTTAPELPATTLANYCYSYMFRDCTNLTTAPELPATTLATQCYQYMFYNCTALTSAPELPATTLADSCYRGMFYGCTNLTTAPELPATTLAKRCYEWMFNDCTQLNRIKVSFNEWNDDYTYGWVTTTYYNPSEGVFVKPYTLTDKRGSSYIPYGWTIEENTDIIYIDNQRFGIFNNEQSVILQGRNIDHWTSPNLPAGVSLNSQTGQLSGINTLTDGTYTFTVTVTNEHNDEKTVEIIILVASNRNFLTFTALEANSRIMLNIYGELSIDNIYYTKNTDTLIHKFEIGNSIALETNEFIKVWNETNTLSTGSKNYVYFSMTGEISASDTIQSLLNFSDECKPYCYYNLFKDCTALMTAPELPAETLADNCYNHMFFNCTSLVSAPKLLATTLTDGCYNGMYNRCTNLTTAPELPATTLADYCYNNMFYNCTSLSSAPELPATTLAKYCYTSMFVRCTSLSSAPELPAENLANNCYSNMFYNCTSLSSAPELPATTLANKCYYSMFAGCTNLTTAPELPASALTDNCYSNMFKECSSLNYIKVGFTEWNISYTENWLYGVSLTGTFVKSGDLPIVNSTSNIPENWIVEDSDLYVIYLEDQSINVNLPKYYCNPELTIQLSGLHIDTWSSTNLPEGLILDSQTGQLSEISSLNEGTYTFNITATNTYNNVTTEKTVEINLNVSGSALTFTALENASTVTLNIVGTVLLKTIYYSTNSINNYIEYTIGKSISLNTDEYVKFYHDGEELSIDYDNFVYFKMTGKIDVSGNIQSLLNFINECKPYCYNSLFYDSDDSESNINQCLISAHNLELPVTTLAEGCYDGMFWNCSNLTVTPSILPAKNLAQLCYDYMFAGCTSLTAAPELPATILAEYCYDSMFQGCSGLITAPELPATTLAKNCYRYMFQNCTSLNYIKVAFTSWNSDYTLNWVSNVASTGTFVKPEALADIIGPSNIPNDWTVENY